MIASNYDLSIAACSAVSDAIWGEWDRTRQGCPQLHSPFLHSEFIRLFARHRDNVYVAWGHGQGGPCGFAFQAASESSHDVHAVGMGLVECQAVICRDPQNTSWGALMRSLGWTRVHFDHIDARQLGDPKMLSIVMSTSPWMDLSQGFEAYCQARLRLGGSLLSQTRRKIRKMAREVGPIEFVYDADPDEAMECLLTWKRQQHVRTRVPDAFRQTWLVNLLNDVARWRGDSFRGRVSLLKAGGAPVAVHLGVEDRAAAHMWYPAYDEAYAKYSPGNSLFLHLAEAMAENGIERFDFGPGGQAYKDRLKTNADSVARGVCDTHLWRASARRRWWALRDGLRRLKRMVGC